MKNIECNQSPSVEIRVYWMGEDPVFLVTGGVAHLGAAVVAYETNGGISQSVVSEVISLPGHREKELADELALMATTRLGRSVAVLAGIHLHNPTKLDIANIVAEAKQKMEQVLNEL